MHTFIVGCSLLISKRAGLVQCLSVKTHLLLYIRNTIKCYTSRKYFYDLCRVKRRDYTNKLLCSTARADLLFDFVIIFSQVLQYYCSSAVNMYIRPRTYFTTVTLCRHKACGRCTHNIIVQSVQYLKPCCDFITRGQKVSRM